MATKSRTGSRRGARDTSQSWRYALELGTPGTFEYWEYLVACYWATENRDAVKAAARWIMDHPERANVFVVVPAVSLSATSFVVPVANVAYRFSVSTRPTHVPVPLAKGRSSNAHQK